MGSTEYTLMLYLHPLNTPIACGDIECWGPLMQLLRLTNIIKGFAISRQFNNPEQFDVVYWFE